MYNFNVVSCQKKVLLPVSAPPLSRNPGLIFDTFDKIANYSIFSSSCWSWWKTSNSLLDKILGVSHKKLKITKITSSFWSTKSKLPVLDFFNEIVCYNFFKTCFSPVFHNYVSHHNKLLLETSILVPRFCRKNISNFLCKRYKLCHALKNQWYCKPPGLSAATRDNISYYSKPIYVIISLER